jgi:N-acetylglucosaminyl-diphospho-decaprenol L-rhamnosyltransferase
LSLSIDVVIPTHQGWEMTESCLRHLGRQKVPHTVVVADNASTDGTPDNVRGSFPDVRLVETGDNRGFAVACNLGAKAGTSDIVVLLNNDVDTRPDFLERLVEPLELDDRIGSVAALLLRPGERLIDSVGLTADVTLVGFPRLEGRPVETAHFERPLLVGPSGGAAAYRREAWEHMGGLDERVFAYMEDLDLALRLRIAGWKPAAAPDAIGVHLGSGTIGRRSASQRRAFAFSRGYFLRRYGVLRGRALLRAIATEAVVVGGDAVLSGDLAALRGRLAGWRAASGLPRHARPPEDALDSEISFLDSLRRRWATTART